MYYIISVQRQKYEDVLGFHAGLKWDVFPMEMRGKLLIAVTTGVSAPHPHPPSPPVCSQHTNTWPTYRCQHEHVSSLNERRLLLAFLTDCHSQFSRPAQHSCQDTRQRVRLTPRVLMVTADAAVCSSAQATVRQRWWIQRSNACLIFSYTLNLYRNNLVEAHTTLEQLVRLTSWV